MATNYPVSLDTFNNPTSGNTLDSPSHSLQHSDINDAVEALETKLGVGTATPGTATAYYPLVAGTAGATSWTQLTAAGITSGTATSGQVLTANGSGAVSFNTPTVPGLVQVVPTSVAVGSGSGSANSNGFVTFSAASSVSLNDVFSSTYDFYKVIVKATHSADGELRMRLRVSGADNSTSNYYYQNIEASSTTVQSARYSTQSSWQLSYEEDTNYHEIMIYNPFNTEKTVGDSKVVRGNTLPIFMNFTLGFGLTTSFTGFTIYPSGGNITGNIAVYGFRD